MPGPAAIIILATDEHETGKGNHIESGGQVRILFFILGLSGFKLKPPVPFPADLD